MTLKNRALYEQHCTWLYPVTFCEIASVSPMPHELWKSLKDRTSLKTECFVFTILAIGEGEFFPEGLTGFEVSLASICVRLRTSSIQPQVPFVSTSTALNYFSSFLLPISQVPVLNRPQRAWRTLHCNVRWSSNAKYSLYCRNYAAPSQHIGYFLLAVSIKPHNQPQGIWETWKTASDGGIRCSFSSVRLRPSPPPSNKGKRSERWWNTPEGPRICLAALKGAGAVIPSAAGVGQPMQRQHQGHLPGLLPRQVWGHGRFFLFAAHLLPLPSRKEVAVPWAESQPLWAVTTAKTFRNVLMAKERYSEIDDLKIEPPQHILA